MLCGTSSTFSDFISSRMREENREQKGRKAQKKVTGREMMEKEEKMEKDGRPQRRRKAAPALGVGSARCCAQGAVWAFPGQRPLAPSPGNHRGQCEAGLFGDVFAAGPVCLFSIIIIIIIFFFFLAVDTSGVEKEEISAMAHSDSGPQVRLWAAGTLQVGACGHWSWTLDVASMWAPRARWWLAQAQRWFASSSLSLSFSTPTGKN